jgi:hypothetical protein
MPGGGPIGGIGDVGWPCWGIDSWVAGALDRIDFGMVELGSCELGEVDLLVPGTIWGVFGEEP